jgi:hypothetical protein
MHFRPRSSLVLLAVLACFAGGQPAAAKTVPGSPPFRVLVVDHLSRDQLRHMAVHGAVGLLVPGAGPTTNRRQALAQLVRGAQMNAHLGGVPSGPRVITAALATGTPTGMRTIVVAMPPKGPPQANDRRYPVVVLGGGFHGLLDSRTTRIPGLVSIVDIAPTALGRVRSSLSSTASPDPLASLASLDRQIHANNRMKLPALIIVACVILLLAAVRPRAATTSVLAALLTSIALGAAQVTSEPLIVGALLAGTLGGGLWLARACRTDGRLLALIIAVLGIHFALLAKRPEWVAITPLGPTQNSRFWGIGNQLETLLLAPLLVGAALAARRWGRIGFGLFAAGALFLVTDNRLGADGGGAIVLGVAFAFLGARVLRLGTRGFVTLLLLGATAVLGLVSLNLRAPGPNHLRSAFGNGLSGLLAVAENRVPLAYAPALHNWPLVLPLAIWFVAVLVLAMRVAQRRATRDLVLAVGLAVGTSLAVNDSATYELVGGVAALAAILRFSPAVAPLTVPVLARVPLPGQAVPNEATPPS